MAACAIAACAATAGIAPATDATTAAPLAVPESALTTPGDRTTGGGGGGGGGSGDAAGGASDGVSAVVRVRTRGVVTASDTLGEPEDE
jgi:hypothetical protein